ncbi:MAG: DUF1667 domain-containing protein [Clostridiales bacterium]|nr:DUF1667 domain-containing protein [Clostridiales bacterium]
METICTVCPKSCNLSVDDRGAVTGNLCPRGETYGRNERLHPVRVLSSTVRVSGAIHHRCPVKTNFPIPKNEIFDAMRLLDDIELIAPVLEGAEVVGPWVTTREMAGA